MSVPLLSVPICSLTLRILTNLKHELNLNSRELPSSPSVSQNPVRQTE